MYTLYVTYYCILKQDLCGFGANYYGKWPSKRHLCPESYSKVRRNDRPHGENFVEDRIVSKIAHSRRPFV